MGIWGFLPALFDEPLVCSVSDPSGASFLTAQASSDVVNGIGETADAKKQNEADHRQNEASDEQAHKTAHAHASAITEAVVGETDNAEKDEHNGSEANDEKENIAKRLCGAVAAVVAVVKEVVMMMTHSS
jgi:hypothetical protein